jgi:N-acetylglucosaminyldiphosphoundecaprenol N-acetyl-beta-D-mannosaminyltransferase
MMANPEFVHPYADVLGVKVSAVNMQRSVYLADRWIAAGEPGYVCAAAVHGVMEAQSDSELMRAFNQAFLNIPDGMPMTWVGHLQGCHQMDRVFGPDFMAAMCRLSVERGYRNFLYGGKPGVAQELSMNLTRRFPGLQIVGAYTPPFGSLTQEQEAELLRQIEKTKPHILWVGISSPKQERFMAKYVESLHIPLMAGVGAAFDFHSGRIHDCSAWIKRAGLQWLHRLAQDPRRLWRRYLYSIPAFLWHIALQLSGLRKYPRRPTVQRKLEVRL